MKRVVLSLVTVALMLTLIFSGCTLDKPSSVIKEIESQLPGCEVTGVEEAERCNTYNVRYNGIDFHIYNELESGGLLGNYTSFSTDYYSQMLKNEEVESLIEKYDVTLDNTDDTPAFTAYISDSARLREAYDFIDELYQSVYDYMPEKRLYSGFFSVSLIYKSDDAEEDIDYFTFTSRYNYEDWDYCYITNLIDVKMEIDSVSTDDETPYIITEDFFTDVDYESLPLRYLFNLYIEDEEFKAEECNINFIYQYSTGTYYAGLMLDDVLQKEIITQYYPDSNYNVDKEYDITTYQINENEYKITRTGEDTFRFYLNNQKSDIDTIHDVDGHFDYGSNISTTGQIFIKVEDWAELMEMNVDRIDKSGVYLSTKQ